MHAKIVPHPPDDVHGLPTLTVVADTQEEWYFLRLYNQLFSYGKVSISFEAPDPGEEDGRT